MADLATLQAQRETLAAARASGTLSVQYSDGARIQYRNDTELAAQLAFVDRTIAELSAPMPHTVVFRTSKG